MRVFIVALGTRGDLELFLTLARQLRRRGHEVLFGASSFYRENVQGSGIEWIQIGQGTYEQLQSLLASLRSVPSLRNRALYFGQRWLQPQIQSAADVIARIGETSDYFISNMKLALARGGDVVPGAFVTYDPPEKIDDLARYGSARHDGRIIELVAIDRRIIDPLNQWDDRYHFTSFWRDRNPPAWQPPPGLENFLSAGPPPVVVTMGSMMMFDAQQFARIIAEALQLAGQRGVIVSAWSGMDRADSFVDGNEIFTISEVPYDWLFPRASCLIHHGGVGTIAAALAAGVPSIILPQVLCQSQFGQMLCAHNLAADVLPPDRLNSQALAQAIKTALNETRYRIASRLWREKINTEDGVACAADLIESHASPLNHHEPQRA